MGCCGGWAGLQVVFAISSPAQRFCCAFMSILGGTVWLVLSKQIKELDYTPNSERLKERTSYVSVNLEESEQRNITTE